MKTADIDAGYGRTPRLRGYTKVCKKLRSTGGWKLRQILGTHQDRAQTNAGAMLAHMDKGEWENALICLEDLREDVAIMFLAIAPAPQKCPDKAIEYPECGSKGWIDREVERSIEKGD